MRRLAVLLAIGFVLATGPAAFGQILYDNASTVPTAIGPIGIVTHPGGGPGGADFSFLTTPDNTFGFGHQTAAGNRLVDDFIVPAGQTWTITGAHVFGYTTGAVAPGTTFGVAQIFNVQPTVGSVPIAGDTTTNLLTSAVFTNIFRGNNLAATDRRVVDNTLTFTAPVVLGPGTYWLEYGLTGNNFSPALNVNPPAGGQVTGNGLQFTTAGGYLPLLDPAPPAVGGVQKGVAFQLVGTAVPEPTSMALVGIGAIGLGLRRLRKKK